MISKSRIWGARRKGLSVLEGPLAVVGLEVTTEGGTSTERWRQRVPNVMGCNTKTAVGLSYTCIQQTYTNCSCQESSPHWFLLHCACIAEHLTPSTPWPRSVFHWLQKFRLMLKTVYCLLAVSAFVLICECDRFLLIAVSGMKLM